MKKLIELDHERNKRALNLIIFGLKEEVDKDTLAIAQKNYIIDYKLKPRVSQMQQGWGN